MEVPDAEDLISLVLRKKPKTFCKHTRNGHFNNIGKEYLLVTKDKNAQILCLDSGESLYDLNLKKREMSTSLAFKSLLFVGTYVDTMFVFSAWSNFEEQFKFRTRESIICMAVVSEKHNLIAIGCANGVVDFVKVDFSGIKECSLSLIKGVRSSDTGYINQIVMSPYADELVLACERGIFIVDLDIEDGVLQSCSMSKESYLRGSLIS